MKPWLILTALIQVIALTCASAVAQVAPTAFAITGEIDSFTVATPGNPLSAATIVIHGVTIDIPANLIVQMPATYLTPSDIVQLNPLNPGVESGLAKKDAKPPLVSFEATAVGNIIADKHIAGLVYISQGFLTVGAGYITSIGVGRSDEMTVGGDPTAAPAATDVKVRLNDPSGRFGIKTIWDPRFTADTGNPTIHAETGYPMCLPRNAADAECPQANRPKANGAYLTSFVMGTKTLPPTPAGAPSVPPCGSTCDPKLQAPFEVGDYITFSGIYQEDSPGATFIAAHTILAAIGIYTDPGVDPAYLSLEGSLVGTRGVTITNPSLPPQETQDRFKLEGRTTDPSRSVDAYALDVNTTTGAKTYRFLFTPTKVNGPRGRFRFIIGKAAGILFAGTAVMGATRELAIHVHSSSELPVTHLTGTTVVEPAPPTSPPPPGTVANGLIANQYVAPVGEYIFPESLVPGLVALPNNFECLAFLQLGSGPLTTASNVGPPVGRLSPWPGGTAATPSVFCGP
jgi:hypothetical protein